MKSCATEWMLVWIAGRFRQSSSASRHTTFCPRKGYGGGHPYPASSRSFGDRCHTTCPTAHGVCRRREALRPSIRNQQAQATEVKNHPKEHAYPESEKFHTDCDTGSCRQDRPSCGSGYTRGGTGHPVAHSVQPVVTILGWLTSLDHLSPLISR